jgi:hypothetical protein
MLPRAANNDFLEAHVVSDRLGSVHCRGQRTLGRFRPE